VFFHVCRYHSDYIYIYINFARHCPCRNGSYAYVVFNVKKKKIFLNCIYVSCYVYTSRFLCMYKKFITQKLAILDLELLFFSILVTLYVRRSFPIYLHLFGECFSMCVGLILFAHFFFCTFCTPICMDQKCSQHVYCKIVCFG